LQPPVHGWIVERAFDVDELERQITILSRELAQACLQIVRRNQFNALVRAASPSAMRH
jgi:hypothetical protein